jgi:cell division protein FtsX
VPGRDVRIEHMADPAQLPVGGDGGPLRPRRWGQLRHLLVGAARDLRRNRTTTTATLVLLSLSLALFGAVLLAGQQLQLVAAFIASTDGDLRAVTDPKVQFLQMLRFLCWSAGIAAVAVGVGGLAALIANVRMVAAARRDEARIMRLVGAGAVFVAASLTLQALVVGFLAGLIALGLLGLGLLTAERLHGLLPSALEGLRWVGFEQLLAISPGLLVLGILAGLVAAILAVSIYR